MNQPGRIRRARHRLVRRRRRCRRTRPRTALPAGQTLHVTEGVGLIGTRDGQVARIRAGDTVTCPPGEEHWHGATSDTFLSHLALTGITAGNDPAVWLEPVPQAEYEKADER